MIQKKKRKKGTKTAAYNLSGCSRRPTSCFPVWRIHSTLLSRPHGRPRLLCFQVHPVQEVLAYWSLRSFMQSGGTSFVKTLHTRYIVQIILFSRVMRTYVPDSFQINLMRTHLTCSFIVITHQPQPDWLHHRS